MKVKIYLAADHAGFAMKEKLKKHLLEFDNLRVEECGARRLKEEDDYPDYMHIAASKLCKDVYNDMPALAFVFGGSGQGEAMVMNRYEGVRCVEYYGYNLDIIKLGREHNNANSISFAARFLTWPEVKKAVNLFLETEYTGGRHQSRVEKIEDAIVLEPDL